jgi:hypothetical protein
MQLDAISTHNQEDGRDWTYLSSERPTELPVFQLYMQQQLATQGKYRR